MHHLGTWYGCGSTNTELVSMSVIGSGKNEDNMCLPTHLLTSRAVTPYELY